MLHNPSFDQKDIAKPAPENKAFTKTLSLCRVDAKVALRQLCPCVSMEDFINSTLSLRFCASQIRVLEGCLFWARGLSLRCSRLFLLFCGWFCFFSSRPRAMTGEAFLPLNLNQFELNIPRIIRGSTGPIPSIQFNPQRNRYHCAFGSCRGAG
jgi:hypothetical protein